MLVAIICLDKPNHLDLRMATRPTHLDWLKRNLPDGAYVGPLFDDDGESFKGSLYILEFDSIQEAREWIKEEPYYKADLFESVFVRPSRNILPIN
mgnify:CR=1 FL=1